MMRVVVSQPMYFPWLGQIELARLADVFVFYSDVQFSRGFINRVQILRGGSSELITVPTIGGKRQKINKLRLDSSQDWQSTHSRKLSESLRMVPFFSDAYELFQGVTRQGHDSLASLNSLATKSLSRAILDRDAPEFLDSTEFPRSSRGSQALVDICLELGASHYLTAHGAKNYLEPELFAEAGIQTELIDYSITPYPQNEGQKFTPFVTALDAVARLGMEETRGLLHSKGIKFIDSRDKLAE